MPSEKEEADTSSQLDTEEDTRRWWLRVSVGDFTLRALYDSGATQVLMNSIGLQIASACGRPLRPTGTKTAILADGQTSTTLGFVTLPFELGGVKKDLEVAILPGLDADCYIGANFMRAFKTIHDPIKPCLILRDEGIEIPLEAAGIAIEGGPRVASVGLADVTPSEREQVERLVDRLVKKDEVLGCTTWVEHDINVTTTRPIKQKYYPVSDKIQAEIHSHVQAMLDDGVIEPSNSGWASPVTLQKKKNGKWRFCIDFRKVNAVTEPDAYPLPHMDTILRKLQKAQYISTLDLRSAYHQIPMAERAKIITAFTVPGKGLYHFRRMPYGLNNAPATFQRLIDRVIGPELEPFAYAYLDDIIIVTETFEEHVKWLEHVLTRINEAGLTINRDKSEFCQSEVTYLGIIVNRDGLRPDPAKVEPIISYPVPRNLKQLRRFIGMTSWYRKFLPDFATAVDPLTALLRKSKPYEWDEEQHHAFEQVKALLATAPVLHRPDRTSQFVIQTDASDTGLGAVLTQTVGGEERVLEFASRTMTSAERNYSVTERECLAVIWAIHKFRPYIEGSRFKVITDHSSLKWLSRLKNPTGRLARWALDLQGYDFEILHRPGTLNYVPDALSRMYEEDTDVSVAALHTTPETKDVWYLAR